MGQAVLPVILFPGFVNTEAFFSVALALHEKGYPVFAVCVPGDAASADAARNAGFTAVEAERDGALRAGLAQFIETMPDSPGVVTVDVTEGYAASDVLRVAEAMGASPGKIVLACRATNPDIRLLSRLERFAARAIFLAVHGRRVQDPWAGLRGIPAAHVPALLALAGGGYRYEFNIVLNLQHLGIKTVNVPVEAVYTLSDGSGVRERALDILQILFLPLKFISASLVVWAADYAVYISLTRIFLNGHAFVSLTASRATGALVGYLLNRNIVFRRTNNTWKKELKSAAKFVLLAAFNYGASWGLLYLLHNMAGIHDIVARMISDILLYALSYTVQREFIFHRKHEE
jgi:putative flippase GtrA